MQRLYRRRSIAIPVGGRLRLEYPSSALTPENESISGPSVVLNLPESVRCDVSFAMLITDEGSAVPAT